MTYWEQFKKCDKPSSVHSYGLDSTVTLSVDIVDFIVLALKRWVLHNASDIEKNRFCPAMLIFHTET